MNKLEQLIKLVFLEAKMSFSASCVFLNHETHVIFLEASENHHIILNSNQDVACPLNLSFSTHHIPDLFNQMVGLINHTSNLDFHRDNVNYNDYKKVIIDVLKHGYVTDPKFSQTQCENFDNHTVLTIIENTSMRTHRLYINHDYNRENFNCFLCEWVTDCNNPDDRMTMKHRVSIHDKTQYNFLNQIKCPLSVEGEFEAVYEKVYNNFRENSEFAKSALNIHLNNSLSLQNISPKTLKI